ncbi:hypothetical protein F5146DRAFT_1005395 [Armillaria mellea]|nr:hypothetical protein F5146DRAFT_1005395 [Armillaria mellea]
MTSTADGVTLGRTHVRHVEVETITFMSPISEKMMVESIYSVALSRGTSRAKPTFFYGWESRIQVHDGNELECRVMIPKLRVASGQRLGLGIYYGSMGSCGASESVASKERAAVALNLFRRSRFIAYAGRVLRIFYGYLLLTVGSLGAATPMPTRFLDLFQHA